MERREIQFDNLDQVVADARMLQQEGYQAIGNWQLSQCCEHLADWMEFPVKGFPKKSIVMRSILWVVKKLMGGPKGLKKMLDANEMKSGMPTDPLTQHALPENPNQQELDQAAIERLESVVQQFKDYQGPIHASPIYGEMDKATAEHLQRIHCALHLSFLKPKGE